MKYQFEPHDPLLSRRKFLEAAGSTAVALGAGREVGSSVGRGPDRSFEHGNPLNEFGYGQVEFAPGPHKAQLEQTHSILMGLDEDSLLRPFRMAAGMPAPGNDLSGWYSSSQWGPTTFGQWISALSRYYAATKDGLSRDKVRRLVEGISQSVELNGKIFKLTDDYWGAPYSYDKLVCGLMDALTLADISEAAPVLEKITTVALPHLPGKVIDELARKDEAGESFTIPENQLIAWQRGAQTRHLDIAKAYLYDLFFEALANGQNMLPQRHAYSHVNSLSSAAKAYLVWGDKKYLMAAINGFAFLEQQSFATGAWGPSETFLPRPAIDYTDPETGVKTHYPAIETLGDSIAREPHHFETPCGSYAHFKLTRYLLRITKNPHYGDSMERVMYNTVLGALPLNKFGKTFYQSNYHAHAHKAYFDGYGDSMEDEWPCCSGTLPQVTADYHISAYFNDEHGVYVNLYIPSTLKWEQRGAKVSLTQSGQYPLDDRVSFEIATSRPTRFALRLRIPAWARAPTILLNGKHISQAVSSGAFATINREWKSGDRIELTLPRKLQLKGVDEARPDLVALVNGPLVLFAVTEDTPHVTRQQLLGARQKVPGSTEWHTDTANGPLRFLPWWTIKDETYFTYLSV